MPEIKGDACFITAIDRPECLYAGLLPCAKRVARWQRFNLGDVSARICQLERGHIASNKTRKINNFYASKRPRI
jgi:hypothetical protein